MGQWRSAHRPRAQQAGKFDRCWNDSMRHCSDPARGTAPQDGAHSAGHQRNRETIFSELTEPEDDWLERFISQPDNASEHADAARQLIERVLAQLLPAARMVITLLEIEDRSVKEISKLTGWSVALVKVRAFRARAEMRKILAKIAKEKYL